MAPKISIEMHYRELLEAAKQGPETVRKTIQRIAPSPEWIKIAWALIDERQKGRPRFLWQDEETGPIVHWSPEEGVLRKLLNQAAELDRHKF